MQTRIKKLLNEIAIEEQLPVAVVHKIAATPWRTTAGVCSKIENLGSIEVEDRPIFAHLLFGNFSFSEKKIKRLTEKK
jgi:hypothetical protein